MTESPTTSSVFDTRPRCSKLLLSPYCCTTLHYPALTLCLVARTTMRCSSRRGAELEGSTFMHLRSREPNRFNAKSDLALPERDVGCSVTFGQPVELSCQSCHALDHVCSMCSTGTPSAWLRVALCCHALHKHAAEEYRSDVQKMRFF